MTATYDELADKTAHAVGIKYLSSHHLENSLLFQMSSMAVHCLICQA